MSSTLDRPTLRNRAGHRREAFTSTRTRVACRTAERLVRHIAHEWRALGSLEICATTTCRTGQARRKTRRQSTSPWSPSGSIVQIDDDRRPASTAQQDTRVTAASDLTPSACNDGASAATIASVSPARAVARITLRVRTHTMARALQNSLNCVPVRLKLQTSDRRTTQVWREGGLHTDSLTTLSPSDGAAGLIPPRAELSVVSQTSRRRQRAPSSVATGQRTREAPARPCPGTSNEL